MIGLKIYDTNNVIIGRFEPPFDSSNLFDLRFSEYLDGVGTASFSIKTVSVLRSFLKMNNIVEIIDFSNSENVLYRGWIRGHKVCDDLTKISLNQMKDALNNRIITNEGTITSIMQALDLIGLPYILNEDDETFDGIDYRIGVSAYSLLEQIRSLTGYNYDYDGTQITFGRVGRDREDIGFTNTITAGTCTKTSGAIYINEVCSEQSIQYDQVVAYNSNGDVYIAGEGRVQVSVYSDVDNIDDLQLVADEYLQRGEPGRVVTFKAPNIGMGVLNIGDRVSVQTIGLDDTRNVEDFVYILKLESTSSGCSLLTSVTVSETKVIIRDEYNFFNSLKNDVSNLQTR